MNKEFVKIPISSYFSQWYEEMIFSTISDDFVIFGSLYQTYFTEKKKQYNFKNCISKEKNSLFKSNQAFTGIYPGLYSIHPSACGLRVYGRFFKDDM